MKWFFIALIVVAIFVGVGREDLLTRFGSAVGTGISALYNGIVGDDVVDGPGKPVILE